MIILNKTPIKDVPVTNNFFSSTWTRFFSQIGDALSGKWGNEKRILYKQGIDAPSIERISYFGKNVNLLFVWDTGVTTTGGTIELDKVDFKVYPSALMITINGVLQTDVAIIENKILTMPDITSGDRVIVQGTALVNEE